MFVQRWASGHSQWNYGDVASLLQHVFVHTRQDANKQMKKCLHRGHLRSWVTNKAVAVPPHSSQLEALLNECAGCRGSRGVS